MQDLGLDGGSIVKTLSILLAGAALILSNANTQAADLPKEVEDIYDRVQKLIVEYYPKASIERKNNIFSAKYDTRIFMIHHPLKTGEWQEAREQEGPNPKGIQCVITSDAGAWQGAAEVPQTFNNRYFQTLLMAPYNKRLKKHLTVHLDYPDRMPLQFSTSFQKLVASFAE
jgi:hypothetical protein